MNSPNETHSVLVGYILWIFGFMGAHRFYFGKPITGTIWFFTAGLLLVGWIIYLLTAGLVGLGLLYDLWTLNGHVSEINRRELLIGR